MNGTQTATDATGTAPVEAAPVDAAPVEAAQTSVQTSAQTQSTGMAPGKLTKLYWHLALSGIIAFGGCAVALFAARYGVAVDLFLLVFCAGSVGAVINNYYRLAKLSAADKAVVDSLDGTVFAMQIYVSVLIAGVLGFVMYGLFLSGMLQGDLFPKFSRTEDPFKDIFTFLDTVEPAQNIDTAKAIVWAFIAGFSERLVPNVLDRLVDQASALRGSQ
jgi:hypothetical protein